MRMRPSFILFETLIGVVLLSVFFISATFALLAGQETLRRSGSRIRGYMYASRALDGARSFPLSSLQALAGSTGGLMIDPATQHWILTAAPRSDSGYTVSLNYQTVGNVLRVAATAKWRETSRSGSVRLSDDLVDWASPPTVSDWTQPIVKSTLSTSPTKHGYNGIAVGSGGYLFISGSIAPALTVLSMGTSSWDALPSPGANNYTIDISSRAAYGVAVKGTRLYVLLQGASANTFEVRVYGITRGALTSANLGARLVASYIGTGNPKTLTLAGNTLYVGSAKYSARIGGRVTALDISNSGSIVTSVDQVQQELAGTGTVASIAVGYGTAFIATNVDGEELMMNNATTLLSDPSTPTLQLPGPATSVALAGNSSLLVGFGTGGIILLNPQTYTYQTQAILDNNFSLTYGIRALTTDVSGLYAFVGARDTGGTDTLLIGSLATSSPYWIMKASPVSLGDLGYVGAVSYISGKDRVLALGNYGIALLSGPWNGTYSVSTPAYSWTEISGSPTGTITDLTDDNMHSGTIPIGFNFPFYGNTFNSFYLSANGTLSFTNGSLSPNGETSLPTPGNTGIPENMIALAWDDLIYNNGTSHVYYKTNNTDTFTLELQNYGFYPTSSGLKMSAEVILKSDGTITFEYASIDRNTSMTTGIQNATRMKGVQICYDGTGTCPAASTAVKLTPVGS